MKSALLGPLLDFLLPSVVVLVRRIGILPLPDGALPNVPLLVAALGDDSQTRWRWRFARRARSLPRTISRNASIHTEVGHLPFSRRTS